MSEKKRLGLIVNPIAGMGGRVGLKGTDGESILQEAIRRGAVPVARDRALEMLMELRPWADRLVFFTASGKMGEEVLREAGFSAEVLLQTPESTSAEHTREIARRICREDVALLLFVGGDGTARDIFQAVGSRLPALGIPAGVKVQSGVFARSPVCAARIVAAWLTGKSLSWLEAEIVDLDEEAYRQNRIQSKIYGFFRIPYRRQLVQARKAGSQPGERYQQEAIAAEVIRRMKPDAVYLIGPGTTTYRITEKLRVHGTLLGIDAVRDRELIGCDLNEEGILKHLIPGNTYLILTPIGGQGMLLGRGNQQISPKVLRQIGRERVWIVATPGKIHGLRGQPLYVDTGDRKLDTEFSGYWRIITGFGEEMVYRVEM